MKKILYSFILSMIFFAQAFGQNVPQGISYQAVAIKKQNTKLAGENVNQIYWSNKKISVKFSIYESYPGVISFSESHNVNTDDYGVFSLIIGQGNLISGNFNDIKWEIGNAHLQIEIDFDGTGKYELIGVEKFWSVPYSFVSNSSNSKTSDSLISELFSRYNYLKNRDKDTVIGNEGGVSYKSLDSLNKILLDSIKLLRIRIDKDKDTAIGNDGGISIKQLDSITTVLNDSISILRKLINRDKDTIIGNEWQNLSLKGDSLLISNGNSVVLSDNDAKNEIQDLIIKNDTIFLTKSETFVHLNSIYSNNGTDTGTTITSNTKLDRIPLIRKIWPRVGLTQINGPWSIDAIFGKQKNWTNWERFNYDSRIDLNFESGDSIIYLSNSNDTIFTYSFNLITKRFSGPVSLLKLNGYNPTNDIELLGNVDRKNNCFYWFGDKGLCIYYPLSNQLITTPNSSSNLSFLSKWNPKCTVSPCIGFKVFLNKKINDTIYFFVEDKTDTKCLVYKYEINQDKLTQLFTSTFSMDSLSNVMIAGGGFTKFFHSPDEAVFSASDYGFITDSLVIFSKVETYLNGKFYNGAFVYNFRKDKIKFIDTRFHGEIICEHPKLNGVFVMGNKGFKNKTTQNGYKVGSYSDNIYGLWNINNNTVLNFRSLTIDDSPTFLQMTGGSAGYDISYFQYKDNLYQLQILRNTISKQNSDQLFYFKFPY